MDCKFALSLCGSMQRFNDEFIFVSDRAEIYENRFLVRDVQVFSVNVVCTAWLSLSFSFHVELSVDVVF